MLRKIQCNFLRQHFALSRQQHNARLLRILGTISSARQILNRRKDWFRLEHHAFATSKRPIVDDVMLVSSPTAQIVRVGFNQTRGPCPANNPVIKGSNKELGKNRYDIATDRKSVV